EMENDWNETLTRVSPNSLPPPTVSPSAGVSSMRPPVTGLIVSTSSSHGTSWTMCRKPVRFVTSAGVPSAARVVAAGRRIAHRTPDITTSMCVGFTDHPSLRSNPHDLDVGQRAAYLVERGVDAERVLRHGLARPQHFFGTYVSVDARAHEAGVGDGRVAPHGGELTGAVQIVLDPH